MTDQTTAPSAQDVPSVPASKSGVPMGRTLVWLGIAGASAALTFLVLRMTMRPHAATDETTERIQALIDEANRLIRTLDEKKTE